MIKEAVKQVPTIKTENIKTITTSVEEKKFTVITVDETEKVQEVTFTYEPERPQPIRVIDVQEFSEPTNVEQPKQIVYEQVPIAEKPEIVRAVETVNRENKVVRDQIREIKTIEKSVTNFVEEYRVQVSTPTEEVVTISFDVNPETKEVEVVDVVKYQPVEKAPEPVTVQETINPVTQIRETVYPTPQTYKMD